MLSGTHKINPGISFIDSFDAFCRTITFTLLFQSCDKCVQS